MLEFSLIKEHRPRFNVRLVDDKSYPYLAVTVSDEWPRAVVMRGRRRKGTRYFGPYAHAYAIRDTLDELLRTFPIRTCSDAKLRRHQRLGKPCLLFHIEKCSAPCVGEVDPLDYRLLVGELMAFLDGETQPVLDRLEADMLAAAEAMEFEQAARLRDRLATVRRAIERQQMVADRNESFDAVGLAEDDLEASVQVFFVRHGRVVGRVGFLLDKVMDLTPDQSVGAALEQLYGEEPAVGYPRLVLVPTLPDEPDLYRAWLSELRGARVELRVPQRGDKRRLAETVGHNAAGGAHPAPPQARFGPQQSGAGAQPAAGCAVAAGGTAAHRVLRHEPSPGERLRGLHGGVGGRVAEARRVPALQGARGGRQRRLRRHGGGAHPSSPQLPGAAGQACRRAGAVRLSSPAPGRRRWEGTAVGGGAGAGVARPARRDPGGRTGEAVRRGAPAGSQRAGRGATGIGGALPPPTDP